MAGVSLVLGTTPRWSATPSATPLALMMANAGGAWDNAKKWIETGEMGGKGGAPTVASERLKD